MPTYVYRCDKCEHTFELITRIDDRRNAETQPCPSCESENSVHIQIQAVPLGDPVRLGLIKPDSGFKEVLQKIHQRSAGSELNKHSNIVQV